MKYYIIFLLCLILTDFGKCAKHNYCKRDQICFPPHFKFGTSTFAYQIEGAYRSHGKGTNVWDWFLRKHPEKFAKGPNGTTAVNSYCKFRRDLDLLKFLGVDFYKFSISWSRVLPIGLTDIINESGLEYYEDIIDQLLAHGIEPHVLMYDHDLPQSLQDMGGWAHFEIVDFFLDYADFLFKRFAGKVNYWYTINDPQLCFEAYGGSDMAPGANRFGDADVICAKNMMLAHGRVYQLFKKKYILLNSDAIVGYAVSLTPGDVFLAKLAKKQASGDKHGSTIGWNVDLKAIDAFTLMFTDPIYSKEPGWSEEVKRVFAEWNIKLPDFTPEEALMLKNASDILVLTVIKPKSPTETTQQTSEQFDLLVNQEGGAFTTDTLAMYDSLRLLHRAYSHLQIRILVEVGWATDVGTNDLNTRAAWIKEYARAISIACNREGVNIVEMSIFSLLDGVYYTKGITERYGLFETDFLNPGFKTRPRSSALIYLALITMFRKPYNVLHGEDSHFNYEEEKEIRKLDASLNSDKVNVADTDDGNTDKQQHTGNKNDKSTNKLENQKTPEKKRNNIQKDKKQIEKTDEKNNKKKPKYVLDLGDLKKKLKPNQKVTVTLIQNKRGNFAIKV